MVAFGKLKPMEREIIEFLDKQETINGCASFDGNITDLTVALGKKKNGNPNVRRTLLSLAQKRLVFEWDGHYCLNMFWMEELVKL